MRESVGVSHAEFDDLNRRGHELVEAGRLEEAVATFNEMLDLARQREASELIDLAVCNRAAVSVELGRGEAELALLRRILVSSARPANCQIAAYNLSHHYEKTGNYKKALFYGRIALERAEQLGRKDWMAASKNVIGNSLLAQSFVAEAAREFEDALELMPAEFLVWQARLLDNLGYCQVLQGHFDDGYRLLYRSLAILRRFGAERWLISSHLDLCFAHLETGRYRYARRHGTAALRLAEQLRDSNSVKNALYLLGETANLSGDVIGACRYFNRLQSEFFPEVNYLSGFLLAVNVRKLVNLHA